MSYLKIICLCLYVSVTLFPFHSMSNKEERLLYTQLMRDYDKNARPVRTVSSAVDVQLSMYLTVIEKVDLKRGSVSAGIMIDMSWVDEYLVWNASEYSNVTFISIDSGNIWVPDLVIDNEYRPTNSLPLDDIGRAYVRNDGRVRVWPTFDIELGIKVSVTKYPFDIQDCTFSVYSWTYPSERLRLQLRNDTRAFIYYEFNGEWEVQNIASENYTALFENDMYHYLNYRITLKRKWLYYLVNIMAPVVLTAHLNIVCFLLPAESGEKVTLSISIFLTLAVFQTVVNSALPESSDGLSILVIYICTQLLGSVLTVTMTVIILKLHHGERMFGSDSRKIMKETDMASDPNMIDSKSDIRTSGEHFVELVSSGPAVARKINSICFVISIIWNVGMILVFVLVVRIG